MNNARTTSTAETGRDELVEKALEVTRKEAIREAARQGRRISEIKDLQHESLQSLLAIEDADGKGEHGERFGLTEELRSEAERAIEQEHDERMQAVQDAPDAYVFERKDATVGRQYDGSRKIELADEVLEDHEMTKRVTKHEAEHAKQEGGNQQAELPETGDAELDRQGGVNRIAFREKGAIDAEGGLKDHTPEYHEYVGTSNRIAKYLNENGQSGDQMVKEAGRTKEGFDKMAEAIRVSALQRRIKERIAEAHRALAA